MKLNKDFIAEKAQERKLDLCTYCIRDDNHTGIVKSVKYNQINGRIYIKIKPDDEVMTYITSVHPGDFFSEPFCKVLEPFYDDNGEVDLESIRDYKVTFETITKTSDSGKKFSNIIKFDYIFKDEETNWFYTQQGEFFLSAVKI